MQHRSDPIHCHTGCTVTAPISDKLTLKRENNRQEDWNLETLNLANTSFFCMEKLDWVHFMTIPKHYNKQSISVIFNIVKLLRVWGHSEQHVGEAGPALCLFCFSQILILFCNDSSLKKIKIKQKRPWRGHFWMFRYQGYNKGLFILSDPVLVRKPFYKQHLTQELEKKTSTE